MALNSAQLENRIIGVDLNGISREICGFESRIDLLLLVTFLLSLKQIIKAVLKETDTLQFCIENFMCRLLLSRNHLILSIIVVQQITKEQHLEKLEIEKLDLSSRG